MSKGLVIRETMSGWLKMDAGDQHDFSFSIQAYSPQIFTLSAARPFRGEVTMDNGSYPCRGELTLYAHGPHYWLEFEHPRHGLLHIEGKKAYGRNGLIRSLITCPMEVFRDALRLGTAEVAYRDSLLAFPFKALRLVDAENAFGEYGEA